jgi:UDP-glucose 4-epimerase
MVMKRLLITGGAGFIGSHLADAVSAVGHEVTVVDNLSTGRREFVPAAAKFFPYDIKSRDAFDLIVSWRPQVIMHHAAQMSVRLSVENPVFDAQENIFGSLNLFQAAAKSGVEKIIFASTGGAIYGDDAPVPARETDKANPECPYGVAKLAIEHYLHFYHREFGIIPISLRYANVYGPRQNGLGEAGVVAIFIEKFLAGQQPIINGDGRQTRDFVFVDDIVAANLKALDYQEPGIYNIGTGLETDILTIYLKLQQLTGSPLGPVHGPAKPGEQRRSALEAGLARQKLDWRPQVDLDQGLSKTVAAFKSGSRPE